MSAPELETVRPEKGEEHGNKLGMVALTAAGATVAWLAFRHWHTHWGATPEETKASLPGDELMPGAGINITHAITIDASPDCVWPWLAQMGQDKAGFYSYAFLENMIGCDMHNAEEVHPEWQKLKVGDSIVFHPKFPPASVKQLQKDRYLVIEGAFGEHGGVVWSFVLRDMGYEKTRLLIRLRTRSSQGIARLRDEFVSAPVHFVMERKLMLTIKRLAEDLAFSRRIVEDDIC